MARLFVANVTKQLQVVFFRPDIFAHGNFTPAHQKTIPAGRQTQLGNANLDRDQLDNIIGQLTGYGLIGEVDVPNNMHGNVAYVYNIDRPVSEHTIRTVMAHNYDLKFQEGVERRERLAIAANEILKTVTAGSELPMPDGLDFEIEQMEQTSDEETIAAGFHVKNNIAEVPAEVRRAKAARAA
jgi:hypothetical protein